MEDNPFEIFDAANLICYPDSQITLFANLRATSHNVAGILLSALFYHYDPVHCAAPQRQPLLESINEAPEVLVEDLDSMEPVDFDVGD